MSEVTPMDSVFQMLAHEHRALEARFAALNELAAADFAQAQSRYANLAAAIIAHLHAEAHVLFPRLARIPDLALILDGSRVDHARIEAAAIALVRPEVTPSEWLRALRRLEEDLEHLIEREEANVFPIARRSVSLDEGHALACELALVENQELAGSRG